MTAFTTTALLLTIFGTLLIVSSTLSRTLERAGIPVALLFLVLGMLAGEEGLIGLPFEDYQFSFVAGTIALVFIVFDGGFNTSFGAIKRSFAPALSLATVGVLLTAGLTAVFAKWIGLSWTEATLLGAVVSSTDAATVFAVMRGSKLALQKRVGNTLELESGLNDAVAVLLTVAATSVALGDAVPGVGILVDIPVQLVVGTLAGVALGLFGRALLMRVNLSTGGLFAVVTMGFALFSFGIATSLGGSGFLAVFATAAILGNARIPYRSGLRRIHDAVAWLSQVSMFLMLGFLVFPSRVLSVAGPGLLLAVFLAFVARPLAVFICLAPFRYPMREVGYIGWVGLRGAVPIVLATYPVLVGVPSGARVFDLVFFLVVLNALVPGATIRWVTRKLGLEAPPIPEPAATLEISSTGPVRGELLAFHVEATVLAVGIALKDLPLPEHAAIALIVRKDELVPARGSTVLQAGDVAYVSCLAEERSLVGLLLGRPEEI